MSSTQTEKHSTFKNDASQVHTLDVLAIKAHLGRHIGTNLFPLRIWTTPAEANLTMSVASFISIPLPAKKVGRLAQSYILELYLVNYLFIGQCFQVTNKT